MSRQRIEGQGILIFELEVRPPTPKFASNMLVDDAGLSSNPALKVGMRYPMTENQDGIFLGHWTAIPINWWLIKAKVKKPCA